MNIFLSICGDCEAENKFDTKTIGEDAPVLTPLIMKNIEARSLDTPLGRSKNTKPRVN